MSESWREKNIGDMVVFLTIWSYWCILYENTIYPFKTCILNSLRKYKNDVKYSQITTSPATVIGTALFDIWWVFNDSDI